MYWKCNDTKYQIQMIKANFWPAMQLTQSSKFWRKKTDLQITPYISPKKFCIISYNNIIWICFATATLYPTLGSCGACTPFSVPPQWNTGIECTLSLPEGALQSLEIQTKGGDSDNGSSWWNLHPSYAEYPEKIPPSHLKSKTDTKIYDKCIRK